MAYNLRTVNDQEYIEIGDAPLMEEAYQPAGVDTPQEIDPSLVAPPDTEKPVEPVEPKPSTEEKGKEKEKKDKRNVIEFTDDETGAKVRYRTTAPATDELVANMGTQIKESGLFDKALDENELYYRKDLEQNDVVISAMKQWYKSNKGEELEGSNGEVIDEFYQSMRELDWNTGEKLLLVPRLREGSTYYDEPTKQSFAILNNVWEKVANFNDPKETDEDFGDAFRGAFFGTVKDFTNYPELLWAAGSGLMAGGPAGAAAGVGVNLVKREALKKVAGLALKNELASHLKRPLANVLLSSKKLGSVASSGAFFNAVDEAAREDIGVSTGQRDDISWVEVGLTGLGGAIAGTSLVAGSKFSSNAIKATPLYKKFFSKFGHNTSTENIANLNIERRALTEEEEAIRVAYQKLVDVVEDPLGGEEGKLLRDKHYGLFKKRFEKFLSTPEGKKFLDPDGAASDGGFDRTIGKDGKEPADKLISKMYDAAGILPSDDIHASIRKLVNLKPETLSTESFKINGKNSKLSGNRQYLSFMQSLEKALHENFKISNLINDGSDSRITDFYDFLTVSQEVSKLAREAGLTLTDFKARFKTDEDVANIFKNMNIMDKEEFADWAGKTDSIEDMMSYISDVSDIYGPVARGELGDWNNKIVAKSQVLKELFKFNLINNPLVAFNNLTSTMFNLYTIPAEELVGGIKARDMGVVKDAFSMYKELIFNTELTRMALNYSMKAFLTSRSVLDSRTFTELGALANTDHIAKDIDLTKIKSFGLKGLATSVDDTEDLTTGQATGRLAANLGLKLFSKRSQIAGDELFETLAFMSRAITTARFEEVAKGTPKELIAEIAWKRAQEAFKDQTVSTAKGEVSSNTLVKAALDFAQEITFKRKVERSGDIGVIGSWLQRKQHPIHRKNDDVFKVLRKEASSLFWTVGAPFVRTPTAAVNAVIKRTPMLSNLSAEFRREIASKNPIIKGKAIGALTLGAGIWTLAIQQALVGNIKGGGAYDMKQATTGRGKIHGEKVSSPYVYTGLDGKTHPIQRGSSVGTIMSIAGDIGDLIRFSKPEQGLEIFSATMLVMSRAIKNIPGASDVGEDIRILSNLGRGIGAGESEEAFSSAGGRFVKKLHPFSPETSTFNTISQILGEEDTEKLQSIVDMYKHELKLGAEVIGFDVNTGLNRIFDPTTSKKKDKNPINPFFAEQSDLKLAGVLQQMTIPPLTKYELDPKINLETVAYTPSGRSWFDHIQEVAGSVVLGKEFTTESEVTVLPSGIGHPILLEFCKGNDLEDALISFVNSDVFDSESFYYKDFKVFQSGKTEVNKNPQEEAIQEIVDIYRDAAKGIIIEEVKKMTSEGDKDATNIYKNMGR